MDVAAGDTEGGVVTADGFFLGGQLQVLMKIHESRHGLLLHAAGIARWRRATRDEWFVQAVPEDGDDGPPDGDLGQAHWQHYWDCEPCSYPDRSGDLRRVVKIADFYSDRQWRSTGMYSDVYRRHTNAQIARRLGLSEGTVRTHLGNIYGRLQVSSRHRSGPPGLS